MDVGEPVDEAVDGGVVDIVEVSVGDEVTDGRVVCVGVVVAVGVLLAVAVGVAVPLAVAVFEEVGEGVAVRVDDGVVVAVGGTDSASAKVPKVDVYPQIVPWSGKRLVRRRFVRGIQLLPESLSTETDPGERKGVVSKRTQTSLLFVLTTVVSILKNQALAER